MISKYNAYQGMSIANRSTRELNSLATRRRAASKMVLNSAHNSVGRGLAYELMAESVFLAWYTKAREL